MIVARAYAGRVDTRVDARILSRELHLLVWSLIAGFPTSIRQTAGCS